MANQALPNVRAIDAAVTDLAAQNAQAHASQHLHYLENCCQALHNENLAVRQFAEHQAAQHQLALTEVLNLTNGEHLQSQSRVPPV